jgi:GDP-D-mannose dehydratase
LPVAGLPFLKRKVTRAFAGIHKGFQECLYVGNIDAKRDWGHARVYVEMMWMMMQKDTPDDYVVATGETNTVRSFIELAFETIGIKLQWKGKGVDEVGLCKKTGKAMVKIDPKYFRPTEVELLIGDPTKAKEKLGWVPKITMQELCKEMVKADIKLVEKGDLTS